jgi:NitT/TauT family transport system substrate-binding protein
MLMPTMQTRRRFLTALSLAGAAGLVRAPRVDAAEGLPETTTVRLARDPGICLAPQYAAEELLRAEGLTDIRYLEAPSDADTAQMVARGEGDFTLNFASQFIAAIDRGAPLTVLAGVHVGCFELFAGDAIRGIADLRGGKSVGAQSLGSSAQLFLGALAAGIGLDPARDIRWVTEGSPSPLDLFVAGKIDAFLGVPPEPQELRARGFGHVILSSAIDRPWSQYFCCMLTGNAAFVREHPITTKRVLRAILKAADLCVTEPELIARRIVAGGFTDNYDFALETLRAIPYDKWREYDPEDTVRFYALRLHEAGMIKSSPERIIADGTNWRFLEEVKRELKA